ncbi:hypothetical protein HYU17_02480 [Candidatus Woesearchaeota archaeon]|nr:hypothetical protein [Candidatus Woesearchaeota archaeon]
MKPAALLLILLFTVFSTAGQYLYKLGAGSLSFELGALIMNYPVIIGLFFYAVAAVLLMYALKKAELSVVYPFIGLSYVWVALLAFFFFSERLLAVNWLGIGFIAAGVSLVGYGSGHG